MAGLGLSDAVSNYQQGVQWSQQQEVANRELQQRRLTDQANKAFSDALAQRQPQAAAAEPIGVRDEAPAAAPAAPWKPSDADYLAAAEARGQYLAANGDPDGYFKNEMALAPIKVGIRQRALEQYGIDKDPIKLIQATLPTFALGSKITSIDMMDGTSPDGKKTDPMVRMTVEGSDKPVFIKPDDAVAAVSKSLAGPQAYIDEMKQNYETARQIAVAKTVGEEQRKTKSQDREDQIKVEQAKLAGLADIHAADRAAQKEIAAGHDAATRYGADQRLQGVQYRSDNSAAGSGNNGLQRSFADADGFMVGVFRDGTSRRLLDDKGRPMRSQDWSKRVDTLAKTLRDAPGNYSKSPDELRQLAIQNLSRGYSVPGAPSSGPGLSSFDTSGQKRPALGSFYTDTGN